MYSSVSAYETQTGEVGRRAQPQNSEGRLEMPDHKNGWPTPNLETLRANEWVKDQAARARCNNVTRLRSGCGQARVGAHIAESPAYDSHVTASSPLPVVYRMCGLRRLRPACSLIQRNKLPFALSWRGFLVCIGGNVGAVCKIDKIGINQKRKQ